MNTQALLRLADALEKAEISEGEFAMHVWDCDTSACAIGWGRRLGVLPPELRLAFDPLSLRIRPVNLETGRMNMEAVADAFDISKDEASGVFAWTTWPRDWDANKLPAVIKRIRLLVATKKGPSGKKRRQKRAVRKRRRS